MQPAKLKLLAMSMIVLVADQASKWWATQRGLISINDGVSFGLFSLLPAWLLTLLLVLIVAFVWWSYRTAWVRQPIASGFFFGGGISNILDRLTFSGVRDWIPVPFLSLHNNLADYALAIGLLLLLFLGLRRTYYQSTREAKHEAVESV